MRSCIQYNNYQNLQEVREKIIAQLPIIYRNTRFSKYTIQRNTNTNIIHYKKFKGLVLCIQKRFVWYSRIKEEKIKILILSKQSMTSKEDLSIIDNKDKYFFNHYIKIMLMNNDNIISRNNMNENNHDNNKESKLISIIPLVDLNVRVV